MDRRARITELLGVREVMVQDKYLGLPTVIGSSKRILTTIIRDKLSRRLQGWKGMLSKAGKEPLIKAVAQAIPTYAMSIFKILATFCNELRSLVSKFGGDRRMGGGKYLGLLGTKCASLNVVGGWAFETMVNSILRC
ncbi:uncharacterized protein LOC141590512 [Silene latifolia]|uniref:uncharacterized protein LOC141590512 n=1 Tax=Silene latifolia TaxID=37657 RepID=UPI003D76D0CD